MRISFTISLTIMTALVSCIQTKQADLIIHNAIIYTVDSTFATAEAMAVKDGNIIAIGTEQEITNEYVAEETIDVGKMPVYPGFIDAHCHFLGYGLGLQQVDLKGTKSFKEVIEKMVEFSETAPSKWLTGRGWNQNDWEIKEFPNKSTLDSLFPDRPVLIRRIDGHAGLANSEALKRAGISLETSVYGGSVEVKEGKLTGILIDNAMELVRKTIPPDSEAQKIKALLDAQQRCFAVGLTTVDDAGLEKDEVELIDQLQKNGKLKMKVYAMLTDSADNFDYYLETGPYKTERLNVRSFKFYGDGALGSRGACLLEPYSDILEQEYFGFLLNKKEYFQSYAQKLYNKGFQMNTHCIGDSANRLLLDVYGEVLKQDNDKRWRIEHAQVLNKNDFEKFKTHRIIPSVQPTHATSDMYWAEDRLGAKRVKGAYAYKDLLEQFGMIALGTDFPVEDISPINTFYAVVFRKDAKDFPESGYQVENALSREQALRGMTIWAAFSNFEENEKGSLEAGKAADFVILSNDLMKTAEEDIRNIEVIATYINGEKVFGK